VCIEFAAAYNLLISLTNQASESMKDNFFFRLCSYLSENTITSSPVYGPSLALQTLSTIFNVLPHDSEVRYHAFLATLKVIKQVNNTQAFDALIPQLETNIPLWLQSWDLDEEETRTLYTTVADLAKETGKPDLEYTYLLQALQQSTSSDSASATANADLATRTLLVALTTPSITDFTPLTSNDTIISLRKSNPALFDLLDIFSSDDYTAYNEFLSSHPLASLSIPESSAKTLETKIRLLTLTSLCSTSPTRSVPYSQISTALSIPKEEVEIYVIDTIRAGLIEGKLSQLRQEFLVQRANYRVFGEKQWSEIQGRLMVWRRSLESVLAAVRREKEAYLVEGVNGGDGQMNGGFDGEGRQGGYRRGGGQGRGGRRGGGHQGDRGDRGGREQRREVDVES
jgi:translation initiation factor 3 subunit M